MDDNDGESEDLGLGFEANEDAIWNEKLLLLHLHRKSQDSVQRIYYRIHISYLLVLSMAKGP